MSNRIDTEISVSDHLRAKQRGAANLALETLEDLKTACPYSTTFLHCIPPELRKEVEQEMKQAFECWANSWVAPNLRAIIAKSTGKASL